MTEKAYDRTNPLIISSKDVEEFERLFPEWRGLLKRYEEAGLLIIQN